MKITYEDRKFVLKMETIDQLNIWKNSLIILKTFWSDVKNRKVSDEINTRPASKTKSNWKMKNINQETLKAIVNEKESLFNKITFYLILLFLRNRW